MVGILLSYWVSAYFQGRLLLVSGRVFSDPYETTNGISLVGFDHCSTAKVKSPKKMGLGPLRLLLPALGHGWSQVQETNSLAFRYDVRFIHIYI